MTVTSPGGNPTDLLSTCVRVDGGALSELMPLVYEELRSLARRHLRRERPAGTLNTGALVHEAWLKLMNQTRTEYESKAHFLAIASRQMRRVLVDHYRSRHYGKRGGGVVHLGLDDGEELAVTRSRDLIALDDALTELAAFDERKCRVVELRFFGGLSIEETSLALGVSPGTVMRDWTLARAWLRRAMQGGMRNES